MFESTSEVCSSSIGFGNDSSGEVVGQKRDRHVDTDDTQSTSDYSATKKLRLPGNVEKKGDDETPIPHPFPFPSNYRRDVQVCLKSGRMTSEARRHFLSSIASTMFAFRR